MAGEWYPKSTVDYKFRGETATHMWYDEEAKAMHVDMTPTWTRGYDKEQAHIRRLNEMLNAITLAPPKFLAYDMAAVAKDAVEAITGVKNVSEITKPAAPPKSPTVAVLELNVGTRKSEVIAWQRNVDSAKARLTAERAILATKQAELAEAEAALAFVTKVDKRKKRK